MTSIKGGGRVSISHDMEEAIMELLMSLRDSKNPLLPKHPLQYSHQEDSATDLDGCNKVDNARISEHDKKRLRKKFLKGLLKCHQHQQLALKLNQSQSSSRSYTVVSETEPNLSSLSNQTKLLSVSKNSEPQGVDGKVRIEVTEAVFKKKKEDSKKNGKKTTKKETCNTNESARSNFWKEGSIRKTMVISRSTTIQDLMKLCKAKLQMKKPTNIFIIDKDSKLDMELTTDLSGIDDGALLYVTSHNWNIKDVQDSKVSNSDDINKDQQDKPHESTMEILDELESIKNVYRKHRPSFKNANTVFIPNEPMPQFGSSLDRIEPLSDERASLPVAACRIEILKSLDVSRVLILSGSTGCG